jgi:hypothetical protein
LRAVCCRHIKMVQRATLVHHSRSGDTSVILEDSHRVRWSCLVCATPTALGSDEKNVACTVLPAAV